MFLSQINTRRIVNITESSRLFNSVSKIDQNHTRLGQMRGYLTSERDEGGDEGD